MTPLEKKELDALLKLLRREASDKKLPELQRHTAKACVGVLFLFRERCTQLAVARSKFKCIAGGRGR
jgi:hypothetical protein